MPHDPFVLLAGPTYGIYHVKVSIFAHITSGNDGTNLELGWPDRQPVEAGDSVCIASPGPGHVELSCTRMHPTQPGRGNEEVHQAYIVDDGNVMPKGTELNMDEARTFWRMDGIWRFLAGRPGAGLWILDKHAKCNFGAI